MARSDHPANEPAKRSGPPGSLPVLVVGRPELVSITEDARQTTSEGGTRAVGSAAAQRAMSAGAPAISSDGRFVAFVSESGDLVPGDSNDAADVFVRDLVANSTILVSRSMHGGSAAGSSLQPAISADGRFVAFTSSAPDLVEGDTNGSLDVFVHDLRTQVTTLVSRGSDGELADNDSFSPSLSADGRFVAFSSLACNLDPDDTNAAPDVFMHDRVTGRTTLVSRGSNGQSGDGPSGQPSVSANGRLVAFTSAAHFAPEDDNDVTDVYVHDMETGENELVSKTTDGQAGNAPSHGPALSADGDTVAFTSEATDLVGGDDNMASDVFVHHRPSCTTRMVSTTPHGEPAGDHSHSPSVSGDGGRVAFLSAAPDLTPGAGIPAATGSEPAPSGPDRAYVRDLTGAGTALVSSTRERTPADGESSGIAISTWGRHVAFADSSTDLAGQSQADGTPHVYTAGLRTAHVPGPVRPSGRHAQAAQSAQSAESSPAEPQGVENPDADPEA
jgi:Tol biopolymer transport system component